MNFVAPQSTATAVIAPGNDHAVFAVTTDMRKHRISQRMTYTDAVALFTEMDGTNIERGRTGRSLFIGNTEVKFLAVRSLDDPQWNTHNGVVDMRDEPVKLTDNQALLLKALHAMAPSHENRRQAGPKGKDIENAWHLPYQFAQDKGRQLVAKGLVREHGVQYGPKRWTLTSEGRAVAV